MNKKLNVIFNEKLNFGKIIIFLFSIVEYQKEFKYFKLVKYFIYYF